MATQQYKAKYSQQITFSSALKNLKPDPVTLDFELEFELEGSSSDKSILGKIEKEATKLLNKAIDNQVSYVTKWLKEQDDLLETYNKAVDDLKKVGCSPENKNWAKEFSNQINIMEKLYKNFKSAKSIENNYVQMVKDWATNCANQQGVIAIDQAFKNARTKEWALKKKRVNCGKALKIGIQVVGTGIIVGSVIASAGTLAPLALGLAVAAGALSEFNLAATVCAEIDKGTTTEQKLIQNIINDLKEIEAIKTKASNSKSKIQKHLNELANLKKVRESQKQKLNNAMASDLKVITNLLDASQKYNKAVPPALGDCKLAENRIKPFLEKQKDATKIRQNLNSLQDIKVLETKLDSLGVSLDDVAKVDADPKIFSDWIKNMDNLASVLNMAASCFGAGSAAAFSKQ